MKYFKIMNAKFIFYASRFRDIVVSLDESKKTYYNFIIFSHLPLQILANIYRIYFDEIF